MILSYAVITDLQTAPYNQTESKAKRKYSYSYLKVVGGRQVELFFKYIPLLSIHQAPPNWDSVVKIIMHNR